MSLTGVAYKSVVERLFTEDGHFTSGYTTEESISLPQQPLTTYRPSEKGEAIWSLNSH